MPTVHMTIAWACVCATAISCCAAAAAAGSGVMLVFVDMTLIDMARMSWNYGVERRKKTGRVRGVRERDLWSCSIQPAKEFIVVGHTPLNEQVHCSDSFDHSC